MAPTNRLSPPEIDAPVRDCAEVVLVTGFTAGATVHVFANGNERIGTATPFIGWWHVPLVRPVTVADTLTAVQVVGGDESFPTRVPVPVLARGPEIDPFLPPRVEAPLLHCQQSVTVTGTVRGARVDVYDANDPSVPRPPLGTASTPVDTARVGTVKLVAGMNVFARQSVCGRIESPPSAPPVKVDPRPPSLPAPQPRHPALGASAIIFDGLITGAEVDIFLGTTRVGGGIASGPSVIFPIPPVGPNDRHQAQQSLCQLKSERSPEAIPVTTLPPPVIEEPICDGSTAVRVTDLVFGATVKLLVDGRQLGQLTATGPSAAVVVGDMEHLHAGQTVTVTQETPAIPPVASKGVTVAGPGAIGKPRLLGGHPFFLPQPGEQAIPGPVYLRGTANEAGPGPTVLLVVCGALRVDVSIRPPGDRPPFPVAMVEKPEGHYRGSWDWSAIPPSSIAVGEYRLLVTATSPQQTISEDLPFFVIFNPAEVTAPARFGFNNTGIWFGAGDGSLRALPYTLHLQDHRVFGWAIGVVKGQTSQFSAAGLLAAAEHNKFAYDLNWNADDTLDLLGQGEAQCADDASMLTALLRAVGIPAHPTTVDARIEFSDAGWNFDTWVEARLAGPLGERWHALHSHHHQTARGPVTRRQAGLGWGEASRSANDMVVMAGESWIAAQIGDPAVDVKYNWNTPCKRPNPQVQAAPWIENLTDNKPDTYWPKAFWECSPRWKPVVRVAVDPTPLRPGEVVDATVVVSNRSRGEATADLSVLLAESRMDSKAFARRIEPVLSRALTVEPGESVRVPVRVRLPLDTCTDDNVFLIATFGDERAIRFVPLAPALAVEVHVAREARTGALLDLRLGIRNVGSRPARDVTVDVRTPFGMTMQAHYGRGGPRREAIEVGALGTGEERTIDRRLRAEAILSPGLIRVEVTSTVGCRRLAVPVVVDPAAPSRPPEAGPLTVAG